MLASGNFVEELNTVTEYWSPRIVGKVNNQYIKIAKLKGQLAWHKHEDEDEMFYIIKGQLVIEYEDHKVELKEGDFHIVPKGKMHNPIAKLECWIVLIETVTTKHTGNLIMDKTKPIENQLKAG